MSERYELCLPVKGPTEDVTHLEVSVWYDLGGANYFAGTRDPRGIYTSVCPVGISNGIVRRKLFDGRKKLLLQAKRLDRKKVKEFFAQTEKEIRDKEGQIWELVEKVRKEKGLELAPGSALCS